MSRTTATTMEAALAAASITNIDTLRRARVALRDAVRDGAGYLAPVLDEVEDALIAALATRRREESRE